MYNYSTSDFTNDAKVTARVMHLAYRRASYLLDRWNAGMSSALGSNADAVNLMARVQEMVTNYEANSSAKLNHILKVSDLTLPGD
jgi:hypothetical protein